MSYSDKFWYSEETRTILVISMFSINAVCLTITSYCTYRLFKLRHYPFIQNRHPNLLFIFTLLSILIIINAPIQCAAFLNIWLRYAKWAVSLNLLLTFYAWIHVQLLRTWILRFDCMHQRIVRNAAWKKELLGEEYALILNKYTVFLVKYKHILGNHRKLAIIFIISYTLFTVIMEIIVLFSSALYQMIILLWLTVFLCGWTVSFKKVPSYDDGLGISDEAKNLKYIAFIFTPIYALDIALWRFDVISEEVYRIMLCLTVTIGVFVSFLIMMRPIHSNYGDIFEKQNANSSMIAKYQKYRLRHFISDYKAFVLYSRQCVKELCAENLIFLFKVMEYKLKFAKQLVHNIETDEEYADIFGYTLLFPKKLFDLSAMKEQLNGESKKGLMEYSIRDVDASMRYLRSPSQRGKLNGIKSGYNICDTESPPESLRGNSDLKKHMAQISKSLPSIKGALQTQYEEDIMIRSVDEDTVVEVMDDEDSKVLISEHMDDICMNIYNEYIRYGSIHQINISFNVQTNMDRIFKNRNPLDENKYYISSILIADKFLIFDAAAREIEHMMTRDTFARFKQTQPFKDFVKTWSFIP